MAQWLVYPVSTSHREGPEICPQPVYKRHCAEKIRLKITGSPEYTGIDVLVKSVVSKVPTVRAYDVAEIPLGASAGVDLVT